MSVDSTPDISPVDQLTIIFRYVLPSGPLERFLAFINISSHTGEALANYLLDFMDEHDLDISLCRGQSYDNGINMSERYNGLQAKIKECLNHYLSANVRAVNAVSLGDSKISDALEKICCDDAQKPSTKKDTKNLRDAMCTLETVI